MPGACRLRRIVLETTSLSHPCHRRHPPFKLPDSWIKAKGSLDLSTPFDFVTDNDIIGGNSGSPVIDRDGHAIGLIFDGNIHSIGGGFTCNGSNNRAVAVDTAALMEAVRKVYKLPRLADELANGHL